MSHDLVAILISIPALAFLLYLALTYQGRKGDRPESKSGKEPPQK